jgi:hypothetical protein
MGMGGATGAASAAHPRDAYVSAAAARTGAAIHRTNLEAVFIPAAS